MKSRKIHCVTVLATGFVVLLLMSLLLFWARWFCDTVLGEIMRHDLNYVRIRPSRLVPPALESDPNVFDHSYIFARMDPEEQLFLGIVDYFEARGPGGRNSNIYRYDKDDEEWMYFDEKTGQIVCQYTYQERRTPDSNLIVRKVQLYAGPEGVSETADKTLGRFIQPIVEIMGWRSLVLYDKKLHHFFQIDFRDRTVTKGPKLAKDDPHNPIQIGYISKNWSLVDLYWKPPYLKASGENSKELKPIVDRDYVWDKRQYLLVLDATGRIDLLDRKTLEFAGSAGYLPVPETLYPSKKSITPKDLLAYEVQSLALNTDHKYRGMYAASVNREGTGMAVAAFDKEGKLITGSYTRAAHIGRRRNVPSSKAVYFAVPWAPMLTISKYLLENLHPPILSLISYFTADSIEASAGHRALFILPNSLIAMKGRDTRGNMAERFLSALLIILPSILLSIFLAWRISINATAVGLSENARVLWILATIALGVVGYITYRLTKPAITLVTCANCGRMRRPDMEKCHRCGSKWYVPELIPPTWRVLDGENQVSDNPSAMEAEPATE